MKALREAKAWLDREWPASIIGSAPPSVHILAALIAAVEAAPVGFVIGQSGPDSIVTSYCGAIVQMDDPASVKGQRVRVLAVGEDG